MDQWPMVAANKDHGDGAPLEGLTYRQVDYWVRRGYLRPAFAKPGSGSARCWSAYERAIAAMMRRLILAGLSVEAAHRVARSGESKIELGRDVWLIVEEESTPAEYAERQLRRSRERQAGLDYERIERARAAQIAKLDISAGGVE